MDVVIYGVGSPLLVDVHATFHRLGWTVVAEVANVDGISYAQNTPIRPSELSPHLHRGFFCIPLLTPAHRKAVVEEVRASFDPTFATVLDPTAVVAHTTALGEGCYINAGSVLGGAIELGAFVSINRSTSVGHHSRLADYASVGPGVTIAGSVTVDSGAFIGAGAVVLPERSVGRNSIVGAGAVVVDDVPPHSIVVGNPARVVREGIAGYNDKGV